MNDREIQKLSERIDELENRSLDRAKFMVLWLLTIVIGFVGFLVLVDNFPRQVNAVVFGIEDGVEWLFASEERRREIRYVNALWKQQEIISPRPSPHQVPCDWYNRPIDPEMTIVTTCIKNDALTSVTIK